MDNLDEPTQLGLLSPTFTIRFFFLSFFVGFFGVFDRDPEDRFSSQLYVHVSILVSRY